MVQRRVVVVALAAVLLLVGSSIAEAGRRGARRNMPRGWTWPPSRETRRDGRRCMRELRALGVRFERARRRRLIATPVVVPDMKFGPISLVPTYRKPPFVMDCRLALALATNADRLAALGIRELRFSSIYDYRRVRLRRKVHRVLSRHAYGLAIDVFKVVLENGTVLDVDENYWSSPLLIAAELAMRRSGGFRAVLGPAIDPVSHSDHLHMEAVVERPETGVERSKRRAKRDRSDRVRKKRARRVSRRAP
jgi:hypothetical protein